MGMPRHQCLEALATDAQQLHIAQRHNLSPKVVNAIAAHHQEVEYTCLESPIVQIAEISVQIRYKLASSGNVI